MLRRPRMPVLLVVLAVSACVAVSAQDKTLEDTVTLEPGGILSLDTARGASG